MSTITKEFTKEQLIEQAKKNIEVLHGAVEKIPGASDAAVIHLKLAEITLASLEAEPVGEVSEQRDGLVMDGTVDLGGASTHRIIKGASKMKRLPLGTKFYTAPPAPVSVPDAMEMDDDFDSAFEHGKAVGWNAYRAAMLQGSDGTLTNEGTITATQFKPVADLYGLTSPTGGETSFTFDAVEARDFIDGGWSCQEYVELGRFQEAITNHTEDKLAMVDHSGGSNNMVEPVTTAYKLPPHIFRELVNRLRDTAVKYQGCQQLREQLSRTLQEVIQPAAPQQEVTQALAKGMERYGDAMQKLADSGD
ncbi:hypothetical protein L8T13_13990 [Enterobacter roggenkampii]|uniref:hypothetical protein n=1 Tax=Enterobacter roggenkampii TaxID=1812935 RepID=UPI002005DC15|nr:hypothetical protein [Enterobacter roggenkampii]MCK6950530.1 hypothetical protein [Enterobacter roggenkampii]